MIIPNNRNRLYIKGEPAMLLDESHRLTFEDHGVAWYDGGRLMFYPWHMVERVRGVLIEDDADFDRRMELHRLVSDIP